MPLPGDSKDLKDKPTATKLLAYEDQFDRAENINLKNRIGHKGLFARGLNYLYQKEVLIPQYNQAKYNQLTKNARAAKSNRHYYVSMLYWAEADRLAGHSRFDEVLKEITPLTQNLSQECGCTVEGQGLATNIKSDIEENLFTIETTGSAL
jgi:predicted RNA-binding protein (virulence factor B family)